MLPSFLGYISIHGLASVAIPSQKEGEAWQLLKMLRAVAVTGMRLCGRGRLGQTCPSQSLRMVRCPVFISLEMRVCKRC